MLTQLDSRLMNMALAVARRFHQHLPRSVVLGDLEQAALIGLLDGLRRDPDGSGAAWEWYLRQRIRGEIIDELRRQDWGGRRRGRAMPRTVHLDDVNARWEDLMEGKGESPEAIAITRLDAAKAWATPLGARDARIMRACYQTERRQKDVGVAEGVSEARVSQRVTRSLAGMRSHLTGEPAPSVVPAATRLALWKRQVEPEAVDSSKVTRLSSSPPRASGG